jgi:hypothetical protein
VRPWGRWRARHGGSRRAPRAGLAGAATWHRPPGERARIIGPHARTRRHDRERAPTTNSPPVSLLGTGQPLQQLPSVLTNGAIASPALRLPNPSTWSGRPRFAPRHRR